MQNALSDIENYRQLNTILFIMYNTILFEEVIVVNKHFLYLVLDFLVKYIPSLLHSHLNKHITY